MEPRKNLQNKQIPSATIAKDNVAKSVKPPVVQKELHLDSRDAILKTRGQK